MYQLRKINGYIVVDKTEDTMKMSWLTEYDSTRYFFHVNAYTKHLFKKDFQNIIHKFNTSKETLEYIKDINLSHKREITYAPVIPDGIILKDFQMKALEHMLSHDRAGIFFGPGTGKTLIAISHILTTRPNKVIIYTPKRVIHQYKIEVEKYTDYTVVSRPEDLKDHCILIINYDVAHKVLIEADLLVLDESHRAKDYSTRTNMSLRKLSKLVKEVYLFTGTPLDRNRSEIMYQLAILDDKFVPGKSNFLRRYFELDDYYTPKKEIRPTELDIVIGDIVIAAQTDSVVALPPEIEHVEKIHLESEIYTKLSVDKVYEISPNNYIVGDSPGKLMNKLRQAANGHILDDDHQHHIVHKEKINKLKEILVDIPTAIIYTQFDYDITYAEVAVNSLERTYVVVNGKTKDSGPMIEWFKQGKVNYLIIQSNSGNAGLDLSNTNNIIFFGLPLSNIVFEQCKARIRRIGQTKACHYYYLICAKTLEVDIFRKLKNKKSFTVNTFKKLKGVV